MGNNPFCPFCGVASYRGHRDYKCSNDECTNFRQPVFTLNNKPLARDEVLSDPERASSVYGVPENILQTP